MPKRKEKAIKPKFKVGDTVAERLDYRRKGRGKFSDRYGGRFKDHRNSSDKRSDNSEEEEADKNLISNGSPS